MRSMSRWQRAPVLTIAFAWVVASFVVLTLYLRAWANSCAQSLNEAGLRMGAKSASIHVSLVPPAPQLVLVYVAAMFVPAVALLLIWRRARRQESALHARDTAT